MTVARASIPGLLGSLVLAGCTGLPSPSARTEEGPPVVGRLAAALGPYSTTPLPVDRLLLETAEKQCRRREGGVPISRDQTLVVADLRGEGRMLLLFVGAGLSVGECGGTIDADGKFAVDYGGIMPPPRAPVVDPIDKMQIMALAPNEVVALSAGGAELWSASSGRIGSAVGRLEIETVDGTVVTASIGRGRYLAWWPGTASLVSVRAFGLDGELISEGFP